MLQRPSLNIIDGSMLVQDMDAALERARSHNRTDVISMLEKVKLGEDDNKQEGGDRIRRQKSDQSQFETTIGSMLVL